MNKNLMRLLPVLLSFFAMGFVDLVGTASNYLKSDLGLSDEQANLFPSLVFFWFLIFSVPTGLLMNRIGRKNTVRLSLIVTAASLVLPIFDSGYWTMLAAFSLLGIGNAIMQTSINPLMSLIVNPTKLAASLTFGQFIKAIASFLAPMIASWGSTHAAQTMGFSWRVLFPTYLVVALVAVIWLSSTPIDEPQRKKEAHESVWKSFGDCFAMLGKPIVLLSFLGIICHVGIDVGTNTTAPRLLQETGMSLDDAAYATSLYFIFRTLGCFSGSLILQKLNLKAFFAISVAMMAVAMLCMFKSDSATMLYVGIALVGYGNSNVFSMCLSRALIASPDKQNEVSGLMIMGLFGGTLFPIAMGSASTAMGSQAGAVAVMTVGVAYLVVYLFTIKAER